MYLLRKVNCAQGVSWAEIQICILAAIGSGADQSTAPTSPPQPTGAEQTTYPHSTFYFLLAIVESPDPQELFYF